MKTSAPQNRKQKTTLRSQSTLLKPRHYRPPTIYLEEPRFVFLPYFNTRLRAVIDEGATWYHYEDVMKLPDLEEAARSMHQRQRLVRRVIAKWSPFAVPSVSRMKKYTVLSEADFFRLMYATKHINEASRFDSDLEAKTRELAQPGGDFDAHELKFYRLQLLEKQIDWRQDKTGSPAMDDWNEHA